VVLPVSANILSQVTTVTTPAFNTAGTFSMECVNSAHCFNFAQILEGWNCTGYSVTVGLTTNIEAEKIKNEISVYPNPAKETLNLNLIPIQNANPVVFIMDVFGKTVKTINNITESTLKINTSNYPKGVYFIKIMSDNGTVIKKVIIE